MTTDWETAIDRFATDPMVARILPEQLIANLVMTKRQELRLMRDIPIETQWKTYLETV